MFLPRSVAVHLSANYALGCARPGTCRTDSVFCRKCGRKRDLLSLAAGRQARDHQVLPPFDAGQDLSRPLSVTLPAAPPMPGRHSCHAIDICVHLRTHLSQVPYGHLWESSQLWSTSLGVAVVAACMQFLLGQCRVHSCFLVDCARSHMVELVEYGQ